MRPIVHTEALRALDGLPERLGGLPEHAILCIRALSADPLTLSPSSRLDRRRTLQWQAALAHAMERLARTAARPALGPVPPDAKSVVFWDRAELLMVLARDWLRGQLAGWWWRTLFPRRPPATAFHEALLASPDVVPAVFASLRADRGAERVVLRLAPEIRREVLAGVLEVFGLEHLAPALILTDELPTTLRASTGHSPHPPPDAPIVADEPWADFIAPDTLRGLPEDGRALLGTCLAIRLDLPRVRSRAFDEAARAWRASMKARREPATRERSTPTPRPSAPTMGYTRRPLRDSPPTSGKVTPDAVEAAMEALPVQAGTPHTRNGNAPPSTSSPPLPTISPSAPSAPVSPMPDQIHQDPETAPHTDREEPGLAEYRDRQLVQGTSTELGGLFYLVNVALWLGFYSDFTHPREPGIALPVWDFVTLVGRELLEAEDSDDPVWNTLAKLSGRGPEEAPGRGFEPELRWEVPAPWIAGLPGDAPWQWSERDGRVRIRHPAGFLVLDVDQPADVFVALDRLGAPAARPGPIPPPRTEDPLEIWLRYWLIPYLECRLAAALGTPPVAADISDVLLRRRAQIVVGATDIDVVLSLNDLPVVVRAAGLDRDPGWIPAAGRTLRFRYVA